MYIYIYYVHNQENRWWVAQKTGEAGNYLNLLKVVLKISTLCYPSNQSYVYYASSYIISVVNHMLISAQVHYYMGQGIQECSPFSRNAWI